MNRSESYISILTRDRFSGSRFWQPVLAALAGLLAGGIFLLLAGETPFRAYQEMLTAAFGCQQLDNCSFWTTLQFATPLMLAGLSAEWLSGQVSSALDRQVRCCLGRDLPLGLLTRPCREDGTPYWLCWQVHSPGHYGALSLVYSNC